MKKDISTKNIKKAFNIFIEAPDEQIDLWLKDVKFNNPGEALKGIIKKILKSKTDE